ncbi:vWA domain-containing protein [Deinococcus lacus]|uniref:VWA domain-containing protein n=1 Tax=Deinococcus lacus TaxID=392561 RepID=A0ABW1YER8_9DEIO
MLDTSGSMRGIGDGRADIFDRVKASILNYVQQQQPQAVTLFTFDSGLQSEQSYVFPADTERFSSDIVALRAGGRNTHLYRSLEQALAPLEAAPHYATNIFVLTDGIDNDPEARYTARSALGAYQGRGAYDRLHYLALGTNIPQDALNELARSGYGEGVTYAVGDVPQLEPARNLLTVQQPGAVAIPYPDGTLLRLAAPDLGPLRRVTLGSETVQGGSIDLRVRGQIPRGTAVMVCGMVPGRGLTQTALRLNLPNAAPVVTARQEAAELTWLNPGADRLLRPGESVTLRYRLAPELLGRDLDRAGTDAPGLQTELLRLGDSRELGVRLTNTGLTEGTEVTPQILLPDGTSLMLASVTGGAGEGMRLSPVPGRPLPPGTDTVGEPTTAVTQAAPEPGRPASRWAWLLPALLLGLLAAGAWWWWRRRQGAAGKSLKARAQAAVPSVPSSPAFSNTVPTIEGIEYSEERALSLFGTDGRVGSVETPLSGPFDVGQVALVPHLSGLRMERCRDGLRVLRVPSDLEVSRGGELVGHGDVIRPGTLLGVAVARGARSPQPPLGELAGLGMPLRLSSERQTLRVTGYYAEHLLPLTSGVTDLGQAFGAPSLRGLKVTLLSGRVLVAAVPPHLLLTRPGEAQPLRPGTFLPQDTELHFREWDAAKGAST